MLALAASLFLGLILISSVQASASQWTATTSLPANQTVSCVTASGYAYCLSDTYSVVQYAPLSSSGVGVWQYHATNITVAGQASCVAYTGYMYCLFLGNQTFFAPISASGVGAWQATTTYPIYTGGSSCAESTGYIYCVGAFNFSQSRYMNSTYYASLSSSGIGAWKQTTSYPQGGDSMSCVTYSGYIYCVAGDGPKFYEITNAVYYAPISSSGIGTWSQTTNYPFYAAQPSCSVYSGYIYCVGGGSGTIGSQYCYETSNTTSTCHSNDWVYYSQLSSQGVGSWQSAPNYPTPIDSASCFATSISIYCAGGEDVTCCSGSYVSSVNYLGFGSTTQTSSSSAQSSATTSSSSTSTATTSTTPTSITTSTTSPKVSTTATISSTTSTPNVSTTASSSTSTSNGGGGVPEFPFQLAIAAVFTIVIVGSYLVVRRHSSAGT
jgi:hypothetical protein